MFFKFPGIKRRRFLYNIINDKFWRTVIWGSNKRPFALSYVEMSGIHWKTNSVPIIMVEYMSISSLHLSSILVMTNLFVLLQAVAVAQTTPKLWLKTTVIIITHKSRLLRDRSTGLGWADLRLIYSCIYKLTALLMRLWVGGGCTPLRVWVIHRSCSLCVSVTWDQQTGPDVTLSWLQDCQRQGKRCKTFWGEVLNWHIVISALLYWPDWFPRPGSGSKHGK